MAHKDYSVITYQILKSSIVVPFSYLKLRGGMGAEGGNGVRWAQGANVAKGGTKGDKGDTGNKGDTEESRAN